jgi:competence protein ComEC
MSLLSRMPVDLLVLPADADDGDGMLQPILDTAESCGTDVLCLSEPWETDLGDLTLTLLLPQAGREENERGIVSLLDVSGTRAMVMGDGGLSTELALAEQGALTDIDLLVAGHHGSATASGAMFLRLTLPETAIVSVGYNSYGLPADEVMDRLQSYCDQVYRTDEQGTVTIDLRTER